jgi:multisubunit Na+/H+ antiporter MnhC subunit
MMAMLADRQQRNSQEGLRWSAALLTAAAAAIHFAVIPEHFDEDWTLGLFFTAAAWSQLLWALLMVRADNRGLLLAGVAGNLAIALVWAASRTTGLPVGPNSGARESVEFIDLLATALEILAATVIVIALRSRPRAMSSRHAIAVIVALALIVIPVTTAAIASGARNAHTTPDTGRTHEQQPHR